jgi:Flp pilus assembly pilin Flp
MTTFRSSESGTENVEYAIIVGLVASVLVAAVLWLAPKILREYAQARAELTGQPAVVVEEQR